VRRALRHWPSVILRWCFGLALILGLSAAAHAQTQLPLLGVGTGCAQAETFIARTSGENNTALRALICGLVLNGFIDNTATMASTGGNPYCGSGSVFDRLFIFQMANSTDGLLDACGHASATTFGGGLTFTANQGWSSTVNTNDVVTGFAPSSSGVHYTLNSAHLAEWCIASCAVNGNYVAMGARETGATHYAAYIQPNFTDGHIYNNLNDAEGDTGGGALANTSGYIVVTRSSSTSDSVYRNGTFIYSPNQTSTGLTGQQFAVTHLNDNGNAADVWAGSIIGMTSIGGNMSATQITNFYSLYCTYSTQVHGSC